MAIVLQRLEEVLTASETLHERLARFLVSGKATSTALPDAKVRASLTPWAKAAAAGDADGLVRRLAWDGVSPTAAAVAWIGDDSIPAADTPWVRLLHRATEAPNVSSVPETSADADLAFGALWAPWRRAAFDRLERHDSAWRRAFDDAALRGLEEELLADLCELGSLAAYERFDAIRSAARITAQLAGDAKDPSLAAAAEDGEVDGAEGQDAELHDAFIQAVLAQPVEAFYRHYPVLARQLAEHAVRWGDALLELLRRLHDDWPLLRQTFGLEAAAPRLVDLGGGHADGHHGGRRVRRLSLATAGGDARAQIIYKPRHVGAEVAAARLFTAAAELGRHTPPKAPRGRDRAGYGWFVVIEIGGALTTPDAVDSYFRRAGALVAFAYAFRGRDLHAENIVATADGPVAVDGEMFFQPLARSHSTGAANGGAGGDLGSCLESGLLLQPTLEDDGRNLGGLRPCQLRSGLGVGQRFRGVGTDSITLIAGEVREAAGDNAPQSDGRRLDPADHRSPFRRGFEDAYRFLVEHRATLIESEVFGAIRTARVRVLLRPSQTYGRAVTLARMPRNQKSGLTTGLIAETLVAPLVAASTTRPRAWPLVVEERRHVLAGDIPHFTVAGDAAAVVAPGGEAVPLFAASPIDAVARRLRSLDEADLERQLAEIDLALGPAVVYPGFSAAEDSPPKTDDSASDAFERASLERALDIGELLLDPATLPGSRWAEERGGDLGLGRGRLGVALFLLGCKKAGLKGAGEAAAGLLDPIARQLSPEVARSVHGVGAFQGLGSWLYGLAWVARLEGRPLDRSTWAPAVDLALDELERRFQDERPLELDVFEGAAGSLVGALAVAELEPPGGEGENRRRRALGLARRAGRRLLAAQRPQGSSGAAWPGAGGALLSLSLAYTVNNPLTTVGLQ
ncbi:MAG: DUF4135 domain-containing protein [Acidobacteriota bacterium]